jgi:hypothetical protein
MKPRPSRPIFISETSENLIVAGSVISSNN